MAKITRSFNMRSVLIVNLDDPTMIRTFSAPDSKRWTKELMEFYNALTRILPGTWEINHTSETTTKLKYGMDMETFIKNAEKIEKKVSNENE